MILAFRIEAEVQKHLKKWLLTAKSTYQTVEYQDYVAIVHFKLV